MEIAKLSTAAPHHGAALEVDIRTLDTNINALVEGFIYEKSIHIIYADPGSGKSTIAMQIIAALSSGTKLFGELEVPKPRNVYYIQLESSYEETIERLRLVEKSIPINHGNLWIDDYLKGVNVVKEEQALAVIQRIEQNCVLPELIIIDPIYAAVAGGLSKDEVGSAFCRFSSMLQDYFKCSILHFHHTSKDTYAQDGQKINRDNSFYGSQWLAAHPHNMYHLTVPDKTKHDRVTLYMKKSRNSNLLPEIMLHFDPETQTNYIERDPLQMSGKEKAIFFLRKFKEADAWPSFYDIMDKAKLSQSHLRRIFDGLFKDGMLLYKTTEKGKKLYQLKH